LGYLAKNAKQILDEKKQADRLLAEAEKKRLAQEKERLAQEKERLAILKRNQQQLDRKINRLAGIVIDVALSDKNYQFSLDKKVTSDLALRGELQRRGFGFEREEKTEDPSECDYLPLAKQLLKTLLEIEKLSIYTADQIDKVVQKNRNDYVVLSLSQWREITSVINGKFSKNFDIDNLKYKDYQSLCKKFDEIYELYIFDPDYDLDLNYSDYSKEISPSEVIKEKVYGLGFYHLHDEIKLGDLFLQWVNPRDSGSRYEDDFFTAEKLNWIASKKSSKFIAESFEKIQESAANKKTSLRLYLKDSGDADCNLSSNDKSFINFPFSLDSLIDLFKKMGYQVKEKSLKESDGLLNGSITISWS
jgi:hypothetical protein